MCLKMVSSLKKKDTARLNESNAVSEMIFVYQFFDKPLTI